MTFVASKTVSSFVKQRRFALLVLSFCLTSAVHAETANDQYQQQWDLCGAVFGPPALPSFVSEKSKVPAESTTVTINADHAEASHEENFYMRGNVEFQRGDMRMRSNEAEFQNSTQSVTATGDVNYEFSGIRLMSDKAQFNVLQQTGTISASHYWLLNRHLRGEAEAVRIEGKNILELEGGMLTSCLEGNQDWALRASKLRLDQEKNEGVAYHARIEFMQVPFFYFPYLSFPISGRKTGFLVPDIGSSDSNGTEIGLPYYWNIAPHRDATFTPYYFSDRGSQLKSEFRYLNPNSSGQVELDYLPNDDKFGDDRVFGHLQHTSVLSPQWRAGVDARFVSDNDYLDDFGGQLSTSSLTHLEKKLTVNYQTDLWSGSALFQSFQTIDESITSTDRPYERLPQITVNSSDIELFNNFSTLFNGELVNFDKQEDVIGRRVDLQQTFQWGVQQSAGFVSSQFVLRHTQYNLERSLATADAHASRSLPIFNIDSGLFFERDVTLANKSYQQTLEPRLYYLYAPYRDQSQLVVDENGVERVFDTGLPTFSVEQLFRNNRFNGADRVGDANQLSMALTSRFISPQGRELLSASLGLINYFRDRKVMLPGQVSETNNQSDMVAELRSRWTEQLDTSASLLWDSEQDRNARGSYKFRYQQDQDRIVDLAYRYERDAIEQADFAVIWPIHRQVKAVGRWYYSLFDEAVLERMVGLQYESCCWAIRMVSRDYINDISDESRNKNLWLQLELKGLASVGNKTKQAFDNGRLE